MKRLSFILILLLAVISAKAVTATVYVQADEAPYLYGWYTVNSKETKINGVWPGSQMTQSTTKTNSKGEEITLWYQTFSFDDTSSFNIIFNNGNTSMMQQTGNITNIASDRYFTYDGATKYTDITNDFGEELPDVEIQSVALISELNEWDGLAQLFTEVEKNAKYTFNLDLTNVDMTQLEDYYRFKLIVNSSAYFDWNNLTLDDPNGWLEEDIAHGGGNIGIDLDKTDGVRNFLLTVTFAGGKDIYEGWTLRIEDAGYTIFVEATEAPYLYAFDANDMALNGEFPGEKMVNTTTIGTKTFWTTKINQTEPFNINLMLDPNTYRTREIYIMSDRYFTYGGTNTYTDITTEYFDAPEIEISSLALTGNHNGWDKNQLFTEVEVGKKYFILVDLTETYIEEDIFQFKLYANACAWIGVTSLSLDAPDYVHNYGNVNLYTSGRNIALDLTETSARRFLFEATWGGGTQMEEGWTLKITEINTVAEPYAVLSEGNTVLTFFYDDKKEDRDGMSVGPFSRYDEVPWFFQRADITSVVFDDSFADCTTLTSTAYWFLDFEKLTSITGIGNLNTANVTTMSNMFQECYSLTSLDLSHFNTANVENMNGMFIRCGALTNLDLSNFNTANVTNMSSMFFYCTSLATIRVGSEWSTANVVNGQNMFEDCTALVGGAGTAYDANHTDYTYAHIDGGTSNPGYLTGKLLESYAVLSEDNTVLTFYYDDQKEDWGGGMSVGPFSTSDSRPWYPHAANITSVVFDSSFAGCTTLTSTAFWFYGFSNLTSITGIEYLKTDNVKNMMEMFHGCSNLTTLDVSHFNTENVERLDALFQDCAALTSLNLIHFNTAKVTSMRDMFHGCSSLTGLDLSSFNTSNVTVMFQLFSDCSSLTSLDISNFNTSKVTSMSNLFNGCSSLTSLDVHHFVTSEVTNMQSMFYGCSSLTSLDVTNFDTSKVTEMRSMFNGCSGLTTLDLTHFNTSEVLYMNFMFNGCSGLTSLDLSSFNTVKVVYMNSMFEGCSSLATIFVSDLWTTASVTSGDYMFSGCTNLVGGSGTPYDVSHRDYSYAHIDGGTSNPGYLTDINASATPEPYAVLSEGNTVLTFFYDNQKTARGGMSVGPFASHQHRQWDGSTAKITSVVFDASFAGCTTLTSTALWFFDCIRLSSVTGIENLKTASVTSMFGMFWGCFALTSLNVSGFNTEKVTDMDSMFRGCESLTNLDMSGFNTDNVTDMTGMFYDCSSLASIQMGNAKIPGSVLDDISNPNLLVYVNSSEVAPSGIQNVVVNNEAEEIVLAFTWEGNGNFYCPKQFMAHKISYTHEFSMETEIGVSRGWETIALPFTVQTITHEKNGPLTPFGVAGGKPFWLGQMTPQGLVSAQQIVANTPYVISMPNNSVYPDSYNQAGAVTFSATDCVVPVTEQHAVSSGNRVLVPSFQRVEQSPDVYAINLYDAYGSYKEGSIFVANLREVRPFEAYTLHPNGSRQFITIDELMAEPTGIMEIEVMRNADHEKFYNLKGQRLTAPQQGVNIVNGRKVVIK